MIKWLRKKIRFWLGIEINYCELCRLEALYSDLVGIGVDVHMAHKSPHQIFIFSSLKGGQLRHIDVHFKNIKELEILVRELKVRYNTEFVVKDAPFIPDFLLERR